MVVDAKVTLEPDDFEHAGVNVDAGTVDAGHEKGRPEAAFFLLHGVHDVTSE